MTLFDPSTTTAAVTAAAYAALVAGHWIGDYPAQRNTDAIGKGYPHQDLLTIGVPWHRGWASISRHCSAYLACQAVALLLVAATVAPITVTGGWAALAVSGATHAVIDRQWIVAAILRAKRSHGWKEGPAHVDQALHHGVLLVAAIAAAKLTTLAGAAYVSAVCAALIAAALLWERRHGRALAQRVVPTGHPRTRR